MRHFFRITGYYDLEGIDENGNPKFTKLAHNVKLAYNKDAESWVINNDGKNMALAVSNPWVSQKTAVERRDTNQAIFSYCYFLLLLLAIIITSNIYCLILQNFVTMGIIIK